jgi:hypothetical protein
MILNVQDNAWHYSSQKQYIEWWYLDALFAGNYYLAGSFGMWGSLQKPESLVIRSDFMLTMPDGSNIDFGKKFQLSDFKASTKKCKVFLGNNSLIDLGDQYTLHLSNDDSVSLDLTYTPECPGFKHTYFFDENEYFSWVVPIPCAKVQGNLQINKENRYLEGVGYHDHNWASVSLSKEIKDWKWGRFRSDSETMTFAIVEGVSQTLFKGMAFSSGGEFVYIKFGFPSPSLDIEENVSGWALSLSDTNIDVKLEIIKKKELLHRKGNFSYQRFLSDTEGKIIADKEYFVSGEMVHEFQLLR